MSVYSKVMSPKYILNVNILSNCLEERRLLSENDEMTAYLNISSLCTSYHNIIQLKILQL